MVSLTPGDVWTNAELVERLGLPFLGGMRFNKSRQLLVLITYSPASQRKRVYLDRWESESVYCYTGMGKSGDQSIDYKHNRTLNAARDLGLTVLLYDSLAQNAYTYVGICRLLGHFWELQPDSDVDTSIMYRRLVFRLQVEREVWLMG
jgi:hypothetical protein